MFLFLFFPFCLWLPRLILPVPTRALWNELHVLLNLLLFMWFSISFLSFYEREVCLIKVSVTSAAEPAALYYGYLADVRLHAVPLVKSNFLSFSQLLLLISLYCN